MLQLAHRKWIKDGKEKNLFYLCASHPVLFIQQALEHTVHRAFCQAPGYGGSTRQIRFHFIGIHIPVGKRQTINMQSCALWSCHCCPFSLLFTSVLLLSSLPQLCRKVTGKRHRRHWVWFWAGRQLSADHLELGVVIRGPYDMGPLWSV